MIERKRVLLSFVDRAGRVPPETKLMTWLFLMREEQVEAIGRPIFYEFVPFKSGPFSFQAIRDIAALIDSGLLKQEKKMLVVPGNMHSSDRKELLNLPRRLTEGIEAILQAYGNRPYKKVRDEVRNRYPRYLLRSGLGQQEPHKRAAAAVYTVGYQGRTIDGLLDHLLRFGIERLIDVRKNAMSRKYGFAGKTIKQLCTKVGIEYIHVPELGIPASMRADLSSQKAYDRLFDKYEEKILPGATEKIASVAKLCLERASALMCFESSVCECHRARLASRVAAESGLEVEHL